MTQGDLRNGGGSLCQDVKGKHEELPQSEEFALVSSTEMGNVQGTSGKMMSQREGFGTPGRGKWEDANKLLRSGPSWTQHGQPFLHIRA